MPVPKKQPKATTSPNTIVPRLLTVQQAAAYLACAVWAVRQLHWESKVRGVTIGRKLLFDRNDLDKYVDALKRTA